jgi:hypothetical protein
VPTTYGKYGTAGATPSEKINAYTVAVQEIVDLFNKKQITRSQAVGRLLWMLSEINIGSAAHADSQVIENALKALQA